MASSVIENLGNNKFRISVLPRLAQLSPVNGLVIDDFNKDSHPDLMIIGNDYGNEPTYGPYDAMTGLILLGNGKNEFEAASVTSSGFSVDGDGKALVRLHSMPDDLYVATQNRDSLEVFIRKEKESGHWTIVPGRATIAGDLIYNNGSKSRVEFHYGSGYLSQSSRTLKVPDSVEEVILYDAGGKRTNISRKGNETAVAP